MNKNNNKNNISETTASTDNSLEKNYSGLKKYYFKIPELIRMIFWALVIVIPIKLFLISPHMVIGASMEPNFHGGDYLLVSKINHMERGDIIVIKPPQDNSFFSNSYIKRLIGLPGDTVRIKDKGLYIKEKGADNFHKVEEPYLEDHGNMNNMEIIVENDKYFVMGDNRGHSSDSRIIGLFNKDDLIGEPVYRVFGREKIENTDDHSKAYNWLAGFKAYFQTYPAEHKFDF